MELSAYHGREHTYFKHRVLAEYLTAWAIKLGSYIQRLWYVDCFAGPWKARDEELADTSISISLEALRAASERLAQFHRRVELGAVYVEKRPTAYRELTRFLDQQGHGVSTHPLKGPFGDNLPVIETLIGNDPALVFVDPTGWKGADMAFIRQLAQHPQRDILINVMCSHLTRFKDSPREFIRTQMRDFLGLDKEMPHDLDEEGLISLYRRQLKAKCHLRFAADLLIPHPTQEKVKYRLVLGARHPEAIHLFRDVEKRVLGAEALSIRQEAKERYRKVGEQLTLGFIVPTGSDSLYEKVREQGVDEVRRALPAILTGSGRRFQDLWPFVLQECHITRTDLGRLVWDLYKNGEVTVGGLGEADRSIKNDHVIALPSS